MKKHLALVLALVMVLTSFSFVSAAPDFSDMNDQPSAEAVARLELLNVLKGYPDGTFRPEGEITRAEFAAVAVRISGLEGAAQSAQGMITSFSDVPAWHWASGYVGIAASSGIVNGIGNGLFAPEAPVKYEEAVTMLVRALGYEPEAQSKGGYPYGYLIVAEDIDLLDGLRGSLGVNATRGLVAQLTDNALEIPMMVSIGFGDNIRWVVSGTERTEKVYLIGKMGFVPVEGRVTGFSTSRETVTLQGEGTFDVMDSFDYLETEGVIIKAWVNDDDLVVAYALQEDVYYDAVEYDEKDEITLVTLDDNFEVDEDADLMINGETVDFEDLDTYTVDFAKVVIDEDGFVVFAKGYNFDNFIVVEEVEDDVIYAFDGYDEEDLDDFDIMKDGETIVLDDIEEGDVVFVNRAEEFAVVYNNSEMGVVDRAYTGSFRMDGTVYGLTSGVNDSLVAVYLEEGDMKEVTDTVLEEFVDEEAEIEVFFDFNGDVVLMSGSKGTAKTSTFGLFLESDARYYENARTGKRYVALDGVNDEGADASFDVSHKILDDSEIDYSGWNLGDDWETENAVIKYTVDEDGDLTKVKSLLSSGMSTDDFKITDRYADDFRLKSGTVFFLLDEDGDLDEVFTLDDADEYFEEVIKFEAFSDKGVYADYIVVYESDAVANEEEVGVVTRVRNLANGEETELSINVDGEVYVFVVDNDEIKTDVEKGYIVTFLADEAMEEIQDVKASVAGREDLIGAIISGEFAVEDLRDKQFTLDTSDKLFELDDAVVLDATGTAKTVAFSAIDDGDIVNVYYEGTRSTVFVKYLVVVDEADSVTPPGETEGVVAYINTAGTRFEVDGEVHTIDADTKLVDADGITLAVGIEDIKAELVEGDIVEVEDNVIKRLVSIVEVEELSVDPAELTLIAGDTGQITATVEPDHAINKDVTWESSDDTVATVADGVVTAVAEGTATITATSNNGKTATTTVTVLHEDTVAMIGTTPYVSLREAVDDANDSKAEVIMIADVTIAGGSGGYGVAGLVLNGAIINGNGNTLTVTDANNTWDAAIYTTGGTIKNLNIGGAFRGIFTAGASDDIIIDNVVIDNVCYTFSSDGSNPNYSVIVTNSTLNGWTSYTSGYKSVSFTNSNFGKGTGAYQYAYMRPYSDTEFNNCEFSEGYELDATLTDDITLYNCTVGGVKLTQDNLTTLLGANAANAKVD